MKSPLTIAIIGSGGREHAIGWKLKMSPLCGDLYFMPGNGGTEQLGTNIPVKAGDIDTILEWVKIRNVDLVIIGPEEPLVLGLADLLRKHKIPVFGPDAWCAQLEGSKSFAKGFMAKYGVPTAAYQIFDVSNKKGLLSYLETTTYPVVLKADGLAAGKGVIIAQTKAEATEAVFLYFEKKVFGDAGRQVVVEEFMEGEEATVFVLTDGKEYRLFPVAQDHKRIGDGDTGKNTGGMGAYAPAPIVTPELMHQIETKIIQPTLAGLVAEGHPYNGILYVGLMIANNQARVVEYNVRFGDPECQVEMMLTESDLLPVIWQTALGELTAPVTFRNGYASVVVAAASGYPDTYEKGNPISFQAPDTESQVIFHAGTSRVDGQLVTSGGRVLNSCGYGESLEESLQKAYAHLPNITFDGMIYRTDIGKRGLEKLNQS